MIQVNDLNFQYQQHSILEKVSFSTLPGTLLSVLGPNGVGKSTLFRCMLGLLRPQRGTVTLDGQEIHRIKLRDLASKLAYIPQSSGQVYDFTVFETVLMGTTSQLPLTGVPGKRQRELAEEALALLGIQHLSKRSCRKISGGERQLALIARAVAQQARIMIMDEPTSNLDYGNQLMVLNMIKELTGKGYTIIQSTHNPDQVFLYADRIIALKNGRLIADGVPSETIDEALLRCLYGVEVSIGSLFDDRVQVCVPQALIRSNEPI